MMITSASLLVFAVNPILAGAGQIAAFVICLFLLILVLLAIAVNLGMAFGMSFLRDKVELIKKLRPYVDSTNHTTVEAINNGAVPADADNAIARAVATVPVQAHKVDQKVEQASDRVTKAVIEFRARTEQAKMVARAFLVPGTLKNRDTPPLADQEGLQFNSPGYRQLVRERPEVIPGQVDATDHARERAREQEQIMRGRH